MSWYPDSQENVNTQNTTMNRSFSHGSTSSEATVSSFVSFKADDDTAAVAAAAAEFHASQASQDPSQPTPIDIDVESERMRSIQGQTIEENLIDLRTAENKYHIYEPAAEFVKYRKIIVAWMFEVGHEYNLADTTIEMAVAYLDRILGRTTVHKTRLQLVSLVCMLLAAKHEEDPDTVPSMEQLNACTNNAYTIPLIRNMEVMVLKNLEWQLNVVVPLHFLKLYMQLGIVYSDDALEGDRPISERFVLFVQKHVQFFSEMCDHEYEFQQYPRSLLAAGIIAAARRVCGIRPDWNAQLKSLTGYGARSLHACFKHIYTHYETQYPNHNAGTSDFSPAVAEEIGDLNQ